MMRIDGAEDRHGEEVSGGKGEKIEEKLESQRETGGTYRGGDRRWKSDRPILESKAVSNLPEFEGSEKGGYRKWSNKLLNAIS